MHFQMDNTSAVIISFTWKHKDSKRIVRLMEIDDSQVICVMADKLVQLKLHLIPFYFAQSSKYFSYSSSIIYLFECKKF